MPTIAEMREKLAQLEATRAERQREAAEAVELKMLEEKLKLGDIEAKEGLLGRDIAAVFSSKTGEMVVVRTPMPVQVQKMHAKDLSGQPTTVPEVLELVHSCLIYPSKKDFERICDVSPAMLMSAVNAIGSLNGAANEAAAGK
jgi:hypothetical protein